MSKKITFKTTAGEDGSLIAEGADPTDSGPAGAVLRLMIGILKQDNAECLKELASSMKPEGGPPPVSSGHATVKIGEITYEGADKAIVPADSTIGTEAQSMPFVVVKEQAGWRVDMNQTMERMMGPMMEALQQGMKQVGEAMGAAMQGIAEGMAEAMGGTKAIEESVEEAPAPPKKKKPRRR
jgi:hypothetical protein